MLLQNPFEVTRLFYLLSTMIDYKDNPYKPAYNIMISKKVLLPCVILIVLPKRDNWQTYKPSSPIKECLVPKSWLFIDTTRGPPDAESPTYKYLCYDHLTKKTAMRKSPQLVGSLN